MSGLHTLYNFVSYVICIFSEEDYIRPYQLQNLTNKTPIKSISESSNNALKFLTPVSYITGLQNLTNSVTKVCWELLFNRFLSNKIYF